MTVPLAVSFVAAFALLGAEAAFLVNYLRRQPQIPAAGVVYRSHPALDVVWALCPAVFVAILVVLTFHASGAFIPEVISGSNVAISWGAPTP